MPCLVSYMMKLIFFKPIEFASTHPYAACGMVVGAAMILTPGVVAGAMLVAGGFTLSGIAAGKLPITSSLAV